MGYQITFRPPKEFVDKELKTRAGSMDMSDNIRDLKIEIMTFCMKPNEKFTSNNINKLSYHLRLLYNMIRTNTFDRAVKLFESEGEIWYCGWNFSHEECEWDLEEIISQQIENFIILKELVNTPDWFDEREKFYEKINDIKSEISGFEEICEEIAIYEVMNMLRKFNVSNEPDEFDEVSDEVSDESDKVSDESDEVSNESDKSSDKVSDESDKVSDESDEVSNESDKSSDKVSDESGKSPVYYNAKESDPYQIL